MNSFNTSQVILYRGMDFKYTKIIIYSEDSELNEPSSFFC